MVAASVQTSLCSCGQGHGVIMPLLDDFEQLLAIPREDVSVEYKYWLDLTTNNGKATMAKAAIALANHGGGFIILGYEEVAGRLVSGERPQNIPPITQDAVNGAVRRYADPEFHVEVYEVSNPISGFNHIVVSVPGGQSVPVMSRRDCEGVIQSNRCYIRKPGPRSEEAQSRDEWRALLNKCIRAQRDDMLDAIRAIVTGRVEAAAAAPGVVDKFSAFIRGAQGRWNQLVAEVPAEMPSSLPSGHCQIALSLVDGEHAPSLIELNRRLAAARRIKLTGWDPFIVVPVPGWEPYAYEDFVEAWVGRPIDEHAMNQEPAHCDFWRVSRVGQLYMIRGYKEDQIEGLQPGTRMDISTPIWRIAETLLFGSRLAEAFDGTTQILIWSQFSGLQGRALTNSHGRHLLLDDRVSRTDVITLEGRAEPAQIQANLAEVLLPLLAPLYERFDFFDLPGRLVDEEVNHLRRGRF